MTRTGGGLPIAAIAAIVVTAWTYAPARSASFVYEDHALWVAVAKRPAIVAPRGLTRWTWWLQRQVPALSTPRVAHVISVSLHLVAVTLVAQLATGLGLSPIGAGVSAALFLLHPLQVESVAYAASRAEILAAIGVLGACVLLAGRSLTWRRGIGVVLCALIGIAGKETAGIALPLVVVLALWDCRHHRGLERLAWQAIAAPAILTFVAALLLWRNAGEAPGARVLALDWLLVQATAAVRLIALTIWPLWPLVQTVDYDYDAVPLLPRLASVLVLVGLAATAWRVRRRWPIEAFGLGWILITIAPRLIVQTPRSYFNEHQWYLVMVGPAIAAGSLVDRWIRHRSEGQCVS